MRFLVQILINALAIFMASYLVDGFIFEGDILTLLVAGLIFGLINFFVKPVVKLISGPLIVLSLGLFIIVINGFMIWLLEFFVNEITITGLLSYFWAVVIFSLINIVFGFSSGKSKKLKS